MFLKNSMGTAQRLNNPTIHHRGQCGAVVVRQRGIKVGTLLARIIQKSNQAIALDRVFHPQNAVGDRFFAVRY